MLSYCIPPLLQWHSATSMERKECCFPHLFKRKHNGLLMNAQGFCIRLGSAVIALQCLRQCGRVFLQVRFPIFVLIKLDKFCIVLDLVSWENAPFEHILFTVFRVCVRGMTTEPSLKRCIFMRHEEDELVISRSLLLKPFLSIYKWDH